MTEAIEGLFLPWRCSDVIMPFDGCRASDVAGSRPMVRMPTRLQRVAEIGRIAALRGTIAGAFRCLSAKCSGLQESRYERSHLSRWIDRRDHGDPLVSRPEIGSSIVATARVAPVVAGETTATDIQWSAIIAGAIAASALAFVLHSFAAAIGLSVSSTAPN